MLFRSIITSVTREVLARTPADLINASEALGCSLWTMLRYVALPYGRGGIVGGIMLGLGRALGDDEVCAMFEAGRVDTARAGDVVSTLENVFSGRPDAERPMIESDSRNNSLTIIAKRGDMSQIQDLIARLDEQSKDSSIQVRLRTLDRVAAEQMARMLQGIYPQMSHGRLRIVDRIAPGPEGRVAPGTQPQAPQ